MYDSYNSPERAVVLLHRDSVALGCDTDCERNPIAQRVIESFCCLCTGYLGGFLRLDRQQMAAIRCPSDADGSLQLASNLALTVKIRHVAAIQSAATDAAQ